MAFKLQVNKKRQEGKTRKFLFLIPARGGSKGIPGKSLKPISGIPLIGRAARLARKACASIDENSRAVCSTDDLRIAKVARLWGAEVPFIRPKALAADEVPTIDVVLQAIDMLGEEFDVIVLLQPTSPLTEVSDVLGALHLFKQTGSPIISVCSNVHPLEWSLFMDDQKRLIPAFDGGNIKNRQASRPSFRANGAIYITPEHVLREKHRFLVEGTRGFLMPPERSIDIDRPIDLAVAQAILDAWEPHAINIAGRKVGPGHPCFIIAEAGVNHNGSLEMALRLVDTAAASGADAVKFQLYRAEEQVSDASPTAEYQRERTGSTSMKEMAQSYYLPWEAHLKIASHCHKVGITYLASCFDTKAVDFLLELGGEAIKIGSGEITNFPLLTHIAATGKPILLSTGMSNMQDVAWAVDHIRAHGNCPLVLLQCVSNYPADPATLNLRAMRTLAQAFSCIPGFSDHTVGNTAATAAVALGACVVEKHFSLDKRLPGPDHAISLEPKELRTYIETIRTTEAALGSTEKMLAPGEDECQRVTRRSLVSARLIRAGEVLVDDAITFKRPGTGIDPRRWSSVRGRRARVDIPADVPITDDMLE